MPATEAAAGRARDAAFQFQRSANRSEKLLSADAANGVGHGQRTGNNDPARMQRSPTPFVGVVQFPCVCAGAVDQGGIANLGRTPGAEQGRLLRRCLVTERVEQGARKAARGARNCSTQ